MKRRLTLLTILFLFIAESNGQEKINLNGTWVLQKVIVNGQEAEQMKGVITDTLFFSGKKFRQVFLLTLPDNQKLIETITGTFKISNGKLKLKKVKSLTNQELTALFDEIAYIKIQKNSIILGRQIIDHTEQGTTDETGWFYYEKARISVRLPQMIMY